MFKARIRSFFGYFIVVSLLFLAYKLHKANYLTVPVIYSVPLLLFSVFLLFVANIANVFTWIKILDRHKINISFYHAMASVGLSIFGKYIPGFVWTIVGRVGYIGDKYKISKATLSSVSLNSQIISLWTGLILGTVGLFLNNDFDSWGYLCILFLILFSVIIFTPYFNHLLAKALKKILKREIHIPNLSFIATLRVMPFYFLNWLLWCAGFQLLVMSLCPGSTPFYTGLGFALGAVFGIMVIFAPGGIGVREGILAAFLTKAGLPLADSVTISVASRLWFLIGEVMFFISGMLALLPDDTQTNKHQ